MNPRRTSLLTAAALAALLALPACGGADGDGAPGASSAVPQSAPYDAQDVAFVQGMEPHHVQAVEMADLVLADAPSAPVRALAERIKAAQQPEIVQLRALLEEFGVESAASGHGGGHGSGHAGSDGAAHEGMMTEEQMAALERASGPEAERLFLELMVEHHEGAVQAADEEIASGEHPEARALARTIKADQEREIAEMRRLLEALGGGEDR